MNWIKTSESLPELKEIKYDDGSFDTESDRVLLFRSQGGDFDIARLVKNDQGLFWQNYDWHRDIPVEENLYTHWAKLESPQ